MRRGFTILELLVASLLLGMLTTVVTMLFNQSSVSWRLGTKMVSDLDGVRDTMAGLREESDNAFVHRGSFHRIISPWSSDGKLRKRACDTTNLDILNSVGGASAEEAWTGKNTVDVGNVDRTLQSTVYMVNVMSGGPKNDIMDWQAIWSYPDDF